MGGFKYMGGNKRTIKMQYKNVLCLKQTKKTEKRALRGPE